MTAPTHAPVRGLAPDQEIQYAIRTRDDRKGPLTTIIPVGDEVLMRQALAERIADGFPAEPLVRTVTPWQIADGVTDEVRRDLHREAVLAVAQRAWEEHGDVVADLQERLLRQRASHNDPSALRAELASVLSDAVTETALYSTLDEPARLDRLVDLLGALTYAEQIDNEEVTAEPGQDRHTLADAAETAINEAADALTGHGR